MTKETIKPRKIALSKSWASVIALLTLRVGEGKG
jgi:hypothetical protein